MLAIPLYHHQSADDHHLERAYVPTQQDLLVLTNAGLAIDEGRRLVGLGGAKITEGMIKIQQINQGNPSQSLTACHKNCHEASLLSGRIVTAVDGADRILREYLIKMVS